MVKYCINNHHFEWTSQAENCVEPRILAVGRSIRATLQHLQGRFDKRVLPEDVHDVAVAPKRRRTGVIDAELLQLMRAAELHAMPLQLSLFQLHFNMQLQQQLAY
jgi:hypothetical protein